MANTRYKIVNNIKIGYDYPKNQFYVENKDTTAYRTELKDIRNVIATLDISTTDISDAELLYFKENLETLSKVYYTWEDTGLYVKTLQFNDWQDYPLTLDCEKAKLYIMNSTTIFSLDTNESIQIVVAPLLCSFYRDTLGLEITLEKMVSFCNFLVSFYTPTCINTINPPIKEDEEEITLNYSYSNAFKLTNFNGKALSTYTCIKNPLNQFLDTSVGNIISLSDNSLTLLNPIPETTINTYNIQSGSNIVVEGISEEVEGETYSADGTHTIKEIEGNTIGIEETFPINYSHPFYNCYVVTGEYTITEMSRTENSIIVNTPPNNILVGDTIVVSGATIQENPYETVSLNGTYTVSSIMETPSSIISNPITNISQSTNSFTINTSNANTGLKAGNTIKLNYTLSFKTTENNTNNNTVGITETRVETQGETDTTITVSGTSTNSSNGTTTAEKTNTYEGTYTIISWTSNTITLQGTLQGISLTQARLLEGTCSYSISKQVIIVEEEIATNFSGSARLLKGKFISEISSIASTTTTSTLTFLNPTEYNLTNSKVIVYNNSIEDINTYTVTNTTKVENLYTAITTAKMNIENPEYKKLYYPVPDEAIQITIEDTTNTEVMPTGVFTVDSFAEAQQYLGLLRNNVVPSDTIGSNIGSKVQQSMNVLIRVIGGEDYYYTIFLKGLYNEIYK